MRLPNALRRETLGVPSTTLHAREGDPTRPDTSRPHRPGAPPPRPAGISRDPARRRRALEEHARNAAPATAPSSPPAPASTTEATPRPRSRTSNVPARLLGVLASWTKRYFAHWRHASTDERGEAIVIVPPRDRRSVDPD